jgi:UDPglucose 6-dehydrogenase
MKSSEMKRMRIVMLGAGYVGLVSAACFADAGHTVTCIDSDRGKIRQLQLGIMPIYEPGLEEMIALNVAAQRLSFSDQLAASVACADATFIAVGTPARHGDGHADLSQVYEAITALAPALRHGALVVMKSTVPVGTCDEVETIISRRRPELDFYVASNPEFLRAGAAIGDFMAPDRIVIGTEEPLVRDVLADIYRPVFTKPTPILFASRRTAELIKYASNAFLATKIAFINEVANLCERVGADVADISRGMGLDSRIGAQFLHAGPGFGGSCFPKDALALAKMGEDNDSLMRIAEAVLAANEARKRALARKVAAAAGGSLRDKTIALLGLTFKPDTDDIRESPSITLAAGLIDLHATVRAYDPAGMEHAKPMLPKGVTCCASEYEAAQGADAIVLATEWLQFRTLDFERLKKLMRAAVVIDFRNIYRVEDLAMRGFRYYRIGAPQLVPGMPLTLAARSPVAQRRSPVEAIRQRTNGSSDGGKRRKPLAVEKEANSVG